MTSTKAMTSAKTTTKATAKTATTASAKRVKFAKFATKEGTLNGTVATKVVRLRDKQNMSWVKIGAEVGCTPRMALRIYDAKKGPGAHHGLLPGKGGRRPTPKPA